MNLKLSGMGLGINPDECISVGKYWLWMTVFSTCLFASCGETNHPPQEPAKPKPNAQVVPIKNVIHEQLPEEGIPLEPRGYEDIHESDDIDNDLEKFSDDYNQSEELEGNFESEPEDGSREVRSRPEAQEDTVDSQTEIALRETQAFNDPHPQETSPRASSPKDSESAQAKWEAQFQVTGDSDAFEPDTPDDFESDSADDFGGDSSLNFE